MASDQKRLSYEQAALRLGLPEDQLRDLKKARRIRDYPDYGGWTFKAEEIEALALELAAEQAAPAVDQTADGEADRLFGTGIDRQPSTSSPVPNDLAEAAQGHPDEEKSDVSGSDDEAAAREERKVEQREWKVWRRKWLQQCPVDHRGRFGNFINRNFRDDYRTTTTNPCELFLDQLEDTSSSRTGDRSGSEIRETSETSSGLSRFGCFGIVVLLYVIWWLASLL